MLESKIKFRILMILYHLCHLPPIFQLFVLVLHKAVTGCWALVWFHCPTYMERESKALKCSALWTHLLLTKLFVGRKPLSRKVRYKQVSWKSLIWVKWVAVRPFKVKKFLSLPAEWAFHLQTQACCLHKGETSIQCNKGLKVIPCCFKVMAPAQQATSLSARALPCGCHTRLPHVQNCCDLSVFTTDEEPLAEIGIQRAEHERPHSIIGVVRETVLWASFCLWAVFCLFLSRALLSAIHVA